MARKSAHSGTSTPARTTPAQPNTAATSSSSNTPSAATTTTTTKHSLTTPASTSKTSVPSTTLSSSSSSSSLALQDILPQLWDSYTTSTPQRTKLLDVFMGFLVVVGVTQFVYCVLFGNYPYNAFLSGFGMTVGQFVLTASLRIQTNSENAAEFKRVSPERAFADYVLGSLILHFFCVNFVN